ncbi:hypothetical protein BBJ28_00002096 [Nothophytophthora sp. Chile5]|nr:hypothetical protein BBJ28_00002096 [Nothophytophthora sp. Chile5]
MVRKKRKGVVKEAQAGGGAAAPQGVDLRRVQADVSANVPLVAAVGDGDLAQWYARLCAASGNLYEQLKLLQLFRSKCKAALSSRDSDAQMTAFVVATWRLVFRLFVAPKAQPLRKNLLLILEVLALSDSASSPLPSPLQIVAATELRGFLDDLWEGESDGHSPTPEQRVQTLDRMMHIVDFPFLAQVLVENPMEISGEQNASDATHLLRFVTFCADQLAALGAPIVDYHAAAQSTQSHVQAAGASTKDPQDEAATSTNVVLVASERCGHALKSVIVLATMKEVLDQRLLQCHGAQLDALTTSFLRVAKHCVLLLQTNVVHKDLLTQAGLAYCLLLRLLLQLTVEEPDEALSRSTTKFLLQAAYPTAEIISVDVCSSLPLRAHIKNDMSSFGDLSRLAIYRGLLNSLPDSELANAARAFGLTKQQEPALETQRSVLDAIFTGVQQFCQQEAHNTRLYAFQVLEAFLRRAVLILQKQQKQQKQPSSTSDDTPVVLTENTLTTLTAAVLLNWEHPSKKVNQFMAVVFAHLVTYFALSGGFQTWKDGILPRLVELPPASRAKYGALTLLVGEAGAKPLLQAHPTLLASLLAAVGQKDYAAPAAANLFAQILDQLSRGDGEKEAKKENSAAKSEAEAKLAWRQLWLPDVIQVLLSRDANLRSRVAIYVMPLLLKKDPDCVPILVDQLRAEATSEQADEDAADVALWALLEVLKYARKRMAPEKLVGVSTAEIERGLRHAKAETRGTAFDALCASIKSTSMPSDDELRLVKWYLVVNGKEIGPAGRMSTLLGLKTVLIRIKETLRLARKASTQVKAVSEGSAARDDLAAAIAFKQWVERFVVTSVYPGALPQRVTLGLEVLLLYVQLFGSQSSDSGRQEGEPSLLLTGQMVTMLLNLLLSAWDSIRSLAFTILDLYPAELPGYSTREELHTLVNWAVGLCGSPRQRESDAGALFIRLLFQKQSAAIQRFGLTFQSHQQQEEDGSRSNPDVAFVLQLTRVILTRVEALSPAEILKGESPLVHGFLLSLRYVLENVAFDQLSGADAVDWPHAMTQVFACVHQSMRASLAVVGDATSGVGDEELSASFAGVVGEVSAVATASTSALRVDCRGHLIVENMDGDLDGEGEDGNAEQRAVVGSWLAARECGAILELLMRRVPLPSAAPTSSSVRFFTTEMAQRGGETLLNSLFELKHKGAVAMAYQAFEGVCRAFLAHGEQNAVLGGLPARWADRLLDRLERSEQHFILRRSSGFAFSFVAILRAEPRNSAAVILPKVMSTLLRLAGQDTDAAEQLEQHHTLWRARVHALNILKLVCQDGVLAEDVARYVVDMFELAVGGFDCGSWAVRNSSMMLFAAATQRAVGDKRIADGGSKQQVASDDVFSRFQQLRGFLVRELSRLLGSSSSVSSGKLGGAAPPGLYPLLLFLSRLRSGEEDESQPSTGEPVVLREDGGGLAGFVPLAMKCAWQPTMAIRHMAAKVVAAIVSDVDAASVLSTLCEQLPRGVRDSTSHSNDGDSAPSSGLTYNYVHGVLTQIRHLTAKHLVLGAPDSRRATASSKDWQAEFFAVVATKLLPSTRWMWAAKESQTASTPASAVIRAELMATLDEIVRFYAADSATALSLLSLDSTKQEFLATMAAIQTECEQQLQQRCAVSRDVGALVSTQPGMYVLDRATVSIWFALADLTANNRLATKMLECSVLQIRKKAIKKLSNGLVLAELSAADLAELQAVLIRQFLVETHPKVRARQLQLLVRCQIHQPAVDTQAQKTRLQAKLMRTLKDSADDQVAAPALELLSLLACHAAGTGEEEEETILLQALSHEIEQHSDENQSLVLRQAAATALRHSDLLLLHTRSTAPASSVELALVGWTSALRLLQDDDVRVRALARLAVTDALTAATALPAGVAELASGSLSDAAVLPLAVEYTVAAFSQTKQGASSLSIMLLELMDAPTVLASYTGVAGAKAQDWDDLYRRIFESESSNYFAERDVLAQNLVYFLLARSSGDGAQMAASLRLREQILTAVASALTTLNQETRRSREEGGQWLGGITYYSSVFATLFGLLTAGVAVLTSTSIQLTLELAALSSSVRQLAQEACDIRATDDATHPLVHRALELLAKSEEAKQGDVEPVKELLYLTPYWTALTASGASKQ